ncbi:NADH:ubiquinone oxidoreductase, NDUFB6/B17 subunit, partial [Gilliamella apicola SCGC AB-598-B02]
GIYPTVETFVPQLVMLVVVMLSIMYYKKYHKN